MKTTRRTALLLASSAAVAACAAPAPITRDRKDPFEGGIGGTGIVGTLYGFGSLLINGLRVELGAGTRYRTPFGAIGREALAPGQVLTVAADRTADGLTAQDVMIDYALVGPLVQSADGLSVNGVRLIAPQEALGHGTPGARVAVSGLWTPDGVRPSRLDPAPSGDDLIAGTFAGGAVGGVALSGLTESPRSGRYVAALGRVQNAEFQVRRVHSGRFDRVERLDLLSVEGYLEPSGTAPGFRISGLGHNFARDVRLAAIGPRRALYFGRYTGLFGAERGYLVPDAYAARTEVLIPGLTTGFRGDIIDL
ncbi:MAG: hypothetical protein AAGI50_04230 [Pseudomonadota bacterium]